MPERRTYRVSAILAPLNDEQIQRMLSLGGTKVELGVQSIRDEILLRMKRGHTVEDTVKANRALRDVGLKVGFHMMPGLPGTTPEEDLEVFRDLFSDSRFRPDYLKIYPTLVVEGTELYELYRRGEYHPLGDDEAAELVSRIKGLLPPYVRLQRVQRDIPAQLIVAGVKKSNLRQLAGLRLKRRGGRCRCIRCREAGLRGVVDGRFELKHETYEACGREEHFFSFEDEEETMLGFLRLRRWSWVLLMAWTGASLTISLVDYFTSNPNYAVMACNVIIAFALNIPEVQRIYKIRIEDETAA